MNIYAAASKLERFQIPDESLESRLLKRKAESMPALTFSAWQRRQPDEEKGRKFVPATSQEALDVQIDADSNTFCDRVQGEDVPDEWLDDLIDSDDDLGSSPTPDTTLDSFDAISIKEWQEALWAKTLSQAVEASKGAICLQNYGLTMVPSDVWQLSALRSLPPPSAPPKRTFAKAATTSNLLEPAQRTFARSTSGSLIVPAPQTAVPLSMILSNNRLTAASLPHELFVLPNLQALALRHNEIERLSPAIGLCANLKELNVSNNELQYLPAEILSLVNLENLYLVNNPFLPLPADHVRTPSGRLLGPLKRHFTVPSLAEISVRMSLVRIQGSIKRRFTKDSMNGRRSRDTLPAHLASLLPTRDDPTANVCDSVRHDEAVEYVRHAEQRMEWVAEGRLRGGREEGGQLVPILWRGCSKGCLDWLEE